MPIQISGIQMGVITGGPSSLALEDLSDVSIVGPQSGQFLRYNSGISEWQNAYLGSDIYDFLNTNMLGSNGVAITYTPGPNTIGIALSLTASGDATGTVVSGNLPLTLATVNGNVGTFGSGTAIPVVTVNAKGLITSVTTASFTGTSPLATSLAGGSTGALPYQSSPNNTAFLAAGTSSQLLIGGAGSPSWSSSISGLTSVGATTFTGALSGNATTATTLQTARDISITGDATWTVNFNGSANVSAALTLATVNANAGTFASATFNAKGLATAAANLSGDATTSGSSITLATVNVSPQTDTFRKMTVNGKGLVTATSAVVASDITTALGFTPVNVAGDTMLGYLILNADPVSSLGAATKQYVDNVASGVTVHAASVTSTTAVLPASTYNNGASGVGATLTANVNGAIGTVGGYASLAVNNRVLVKDQAAALQNGIYVVTQLGSAGTPWVLTRASDFDGTPASEIQSGDATYVQNGTLAGTQWVVVTTGTITVGTTAINFSQFSGPGTYTGGSGINVTGTSISNTGVLSNIAGTGIGVSGATGNVTITNNGVVSVAGTSNQITVSGSTGAVTFSLPSSVTIGGTMTAGIFSGSGASLTSIPNAALTNNSLTIGSTNIALGATSTSLAGLTSVTSTTFVGALSGNATTATTSTNIAGGAAGSIPYQTAASTTTLLAAGTSSQVLVSGTTPSWTNTPTLTGTNFSGSAASLNAGTATVLQTARTINGTSFNGSANITITASTTAALTMNNGGAGAASGTTFDGSTARTISYNTIGAPSTTGSGASGTWAISITGNSVTVGGFTPSATAGVASRVVVADGSGYINNSYFNGTDEGISGSAGTVTSILTKRGDNYYRATSAQSVMNYLVNTSNIWPNTQVQQFATINSVGFAGQSGNLQAFATSGSGLSAVMSFHRAGLYAINMGMDTDNVFRLGGWSDGASTYRYQVDTAGNFYTGATVFPTNGSNGLRSNSGTYGSLEITGTQNAYSGVYFSGGGASTTGMFDASGNGGDYDGTTGWHFYWQRSNSCLGIGGSVTAVGYRAYTNGNHYVAGKIDVASNTTGVGTGVTAINGDMTAYRSGGTTGVIYLSSSGTKYLFYDGTNYNLNAGGLVVTGDVTAFSDIRVKKNIEVIPDALNKVLQIRGVTFQRTDTDDDVTRHTGVIAQEVEKVLPEVVVTSNEALDGQEGKKTVAYGNMVGLLIEAIKELNAKVDSLKAELAALKG